ncbi:MAG: hypothetical protein ABIP67_15290 [Burkholderiales bacterium]
MKRTFESPLVGFAYLLLPALWFGLLVGVSFIATPAKFDAASLALPVALDVGRATFAIFNKVEWFLAAAMIPVVIFSGPRLFPSMAVVVLGNLLLAQSAWLLPMLNDRIETIMAGGHPRPSLDHIFYIGIDLVKLAVLAAMVWKEGTRILPLMLRLPKIER